MNNRIKQELINRIQNYDAFLDIYNAYQQAINGDDEIWDMQSLGEVLQDMNPVEIVQRTAYGDMNLSHSYFHFDGYGNLESIDTWKLNHEINTYAMANEIAEYIIESEDALGDDGIQNILDKQEV